MRRIVRILCLLRNQCWIELLIAIHIARIDILRRLAIRSLRKIRHLFTGICGTTHWELGLD